MRYAFEDYTLDSERFELRKDSVAVAMEPQVFEVLRYLVEHNDRLVTRQELLDHVWPEHYITEAALSSRVMAARKAVGDDGRQQRLIATVHGRGFRFAAPVKLHEAAAPPTEEAAVAPSLAPPPVEMTVRPASPDPTFLGRIGELRRLEEMFSLPGTRLVTLAGPGGVGKTRLAQAYVANLSSPTAFVSLEGCHDLSDLPFRIATAANVPLRGDADPLDELGARLSGGLTLLVLDNLEHLLPHAAEIVEALLASAPSLRLLVTSRVVVGLRAEWLLPVGGLATMVPAGQACSEAAQLFLLRSQMSGATLTNPADPEIDAICNAVDGMPLAIELAASLTRYLSLAEIRARVLHEVGSLQTTLKDVPVRHRSIPGLLEESFRHLTVEQMRALLALSVFEDTFDAAAAEAVAAAPLQTLIALADRSLVRSMNGRFSLHPLLRQFARERLRDGERDLRSDHARYFLGFLADRTALLEGEGQLTAVREVQSEFANVMHAWRWASEDSRLDLLDGAAYPLYLHVSFSALLSEVREPLAAAIRAAEAAGDPGADLLARLLTHEAWALLQTRRAMEVPLIVARVRDLQAAGLARQGPGMGMDIDLLEARLAAGRGRYETSTELARGAAARAKARGDVIGEATAQWLAGFGLTRRATVEWDSSDGVSGTFHVIRDAGGSSPIDEAEEAVSRAVTLLGDRGERWLRSLAETELGVIVEMRGDAATALRCHTAALETSREFADSYGEAGRLVRISDLRVGLGQAQAAGDLLALAEPIVRRFTGTVLQSEFDRSRGQLAVLERDTIQAAGWFTAAIESSLVAGVANNIVGILVGIATLLRAEGEVHDACDVLQRVIGHRAATPFSRAKALYLLRELGGQLPIKGEAMPLPDFARLMVSRLK